MTHTFKEHRELAKMALQAKVGQLDAKSLSRRAAVLYDHLTSEELEELAHIGVPVGR